MKFENIIGVYNSGNYKILNIFGIKLKFKNKHAVILNRMRDMQRDLVKQNKRLITTALLHQKTFSKFKGINRGKDVLLVGAGPSLNHLEPIEGTVNVGLNRTFIFDKIKMDYLFAIDKVGIEQYYDGFINYRPDECIKFVGDQNLGADFQIPEYVALESKALRYKTCTKLYPSDFTLDIDSEPLGNFCTVSLQAMQFILFTYPKRVYIAGIDCNMTKAGHFSGKSFDTSKRNEDSQKNDDNSIIFWSRLKDFAACYYPDTEIVSINPVGLRGIFKEVWTESYLAEHPEIRAELGNDIEILSNFANNQKIGGG